MAIRSEELYPGEAVVYRFPSSARRRSRSVARRRVISGVAVVLISFALLFATGPEGSAVASSQGAPRAVILQPGDTLWELAETYSRPGSDPRAYVAAIQELNDLHGIPQAGQRLRLPR